MPTGTAAAVPVVGPAPERRIVASAAVVFKAAGGGGVGRRGSRGADADGDDAVLGGGRQLRQPNLRRRLQIVICHSYAS